MSYGHAERNLAAVLVLRAETIRLLANRRVLTPEETEWRDEVMAARLAKHGRVGRADHERYTQSMCDATSSSR